MSVVLRFDIAGVSYFANTYENTSLQITKRVSTLDTLSSQSIITKETFRVPLEGGLLQLLGLISDAGQQANINLNKKIDGQILIDDFPRFKGSFQVINIFQFPDNEAAEIELIFKGNETNLKQELTNIMMSELYDGELIPYTSADIESFINDAEGFTDTNGYFYPLVDYGQRFTTDTNATVGKIIGVNNLDQTDFKPAVTIEDCFNRMGIDVTWDSSIDDLIKYQGILLHNNESNIPILDTSPRDYTGNLTTNINTTYTASGFNQIPFQVVNAYNQTSVFDLPNDYYVPAVSGTHTMRIIGSVDIYNNDAVLALILSVFQIYDYTNAAIIVPTVFSANLAVNAISTRTLNIDVTFSADLVSGTNYGLRYSFTDKTGLDTATINSGFKWDIISSPAIVSTSNIDVPLNCPDLNAWDIFSTVVRQCNGIIETAIDGVYNIVPWVAWIDSNSDYIILDDKVDPSKNIQVTPFSVKGAKKIKLSYQEDEDLFNQTYKKLQGGTYGTLSIEDTGTDFASNEIKIELPFASSPISNIDGSGFPILKLYNEEFETIKGLPRLLNFNAAFDNLPLSYGLTDAVIGGGLSYDYFPFCGHWSIEGGTLGGYNANDYNFGQSLTFFAGEGYPNNNLYERFWRKYIEETYSENSREVTFSVNLDIEQVGDFKLNEQVFFKGIKYRIVELNNVPITKMDTFPIKLMKRLSIENIDIAPFYHYDVINGIIQWKSSTDNTDLGDASTEPAADVEASALAYGFAYDANRNIANQRGQLLQI